MGQGKLVEAWLSVRRIKANFVIIHNKYNESILHLDNLYRKQYMYNVSEMYKIKKKFFNRHLKCIKKKVPRNSKILNHNVKIYSKQKSEPYKKNQRVIKNVGIIIDLSHDRFERLHSKFFIQRFYQNKKNIIKKINNQYLRRNLEKNKKTKKGRKEMYLGCPSN